MPLQQFNDATSPYESKIEERLVFFLVFIGVLASTYAFLFLIDFLPEKPGMSVERVSTITPSSRESVTEGEMSSIANTSGVAGTHIDVGDSSHTERDNEGVSYEHAGDIDPYPNRIIFDALEGRTVTVLNPASRSVEALDTALLSGVVRHPDSADFERTGTIFLFGHSSYLPNVMNKNFQAFNGIQKMTWGDTIRLQSSDTEYVYRVDRVYEASANDAEVKIETGKAKLTLVTCDSFGAKSDRFVVEATLIEERSLDA
jgi:LPXTG-site transpeptidase (sortase) family protein